MKTTSSNLALGLVAILTFLSSVPALALEHWYVPDLPFEKIVVRNKSSHSQYFWFSGPIQNLTPNWEQSFELEPHSTIDLSAFRPKGSFFHLKSLNKGSLELSVKIINQQTQIWPSGTGLDYSLVVNTQSDWIITNLTPYNQTVRIFGLENRSEILEGFQQKRLSLSRGIYEIKAEAKLQVWDTLNNSPAKPNERPSQLSPQPGAYFLVSNPSQTSSYTVKISDPQLIEQARRQIEKPTLFLPRIVFGKVSSGHLNQNRDWHSSQKLPWSWSIEVIEFGEIASQSCDGSAELLEEILMPWIDSQSYICFWSYKITRELSILEMTTGIDHKP